MNLHDIFQQFHKAVYEENYTCSLCGREVFGGSAFCADCRRTLPYNARYCARCGRKIGQEGYCMDCRAHPFFSDKARSLFVYEGEARSLIYAFKTGRRDLAEVFAREAFPIVEREFFDAQHIAFVPMTARKLRARGYNQSELFARGMSALTGIPCGDFFEKTRETDDQKSLGMGERQKNLRGAFRLKDRAACKEQCVLLLDDTMTTGATSAELCRLLYAAHARKVYVLTVASVVL